MSEGQNVYVLGGGLHPFGRFPDKPVEEIARVAIQNALDDSGVPFEDIEVAYCGHVYQGMGAGLRVVTQFGQTGIPIVNIELACASSSTAVRQAYWAISAGLFDVALVTGFEKMQRGLLNIVPPDSYDYKMGLSALPSAYAMNAKAYMSKFEVSADAFAYVSVKSHRLGALNPNAQYQKEVTIEEVKASRMISDRSHCSSAHRLPTARPPSSWPPKRPPSVTPRRTGGSKSPVGPRVRRSSLPTQLRQRSMNSAKGP